MLKDSHNKTEDIIRYQLQKSNSWVKTLSFNNERRKENKKSYEFRYKDSYKFDSGNNKIPDGYYLIPFAMLVSELIPANQINEIKNGLRKILEKQQANNFRGGVTFSKDIDSIRTYSPGYSFWRKIGSINFNNDDLLSDIIKNIDIEISNFNDSYVLLDLTVSFSQKQEKILLNLINNDFTNDQAQYHKIFEKKNRDKTGSKYYISKGYINKDIAKQNAIEREYIKTKKKIFDEFSKYLPIKMHKLDIIPPSCILYKTNIFSNKKASRDFLHSIGFPHPFSDKDSPLNIPSSSLAYEVEGSGYSNNSILFLDEEINHKEMYYSKEFQISKEFQKNIYRTTRAHHISYYLLPEYSDSNITYRSKFENIKISRRNLNELYKIRNEYFKEMIFFENTMNPLKMDKTDKSYANKLEIRYFDKVKGYADFYSITRNTEIQKFAETISKELNDKIDILKDLSEIHNNKTITYMTFLSLLIALISLLVALEFDFKVTLKFFKELLFTLL